MLVKFRTNLGRIDAGKLKIANWQECVRDAEVEVHDAAAESLIARKFAVACEKKVKAVSPAPSIKGVNEEFSKKSDK